MITREGEEEKLEYVILGGVYEWKRVSLRDISVRESQLRGTYEARLVLKAERNETRQ